MTKANIRGKIRWGIFGIIALLFVSSVFVAPQVFNKGIDWANNTIHLGLPKVPERDFRLGLDLQGGAHLVYEADTSNIPAGEESAAVEGVRDVIERRINGIGVSEAQVQTTQVGEDQRIIVELPGVSDVQQAISMIGATPILEFKEINNEPPRELTAEEQTQMDEYNKDAKARANDLLKQVKKDSSVFETLATENSEDENSKNNGGYMNYISANSQYTEIYDWAKDVKEGTIVKIL